jgi:dihydroorotate dehydrogenase
MFYSLTKKILFKFDAEDVHNLAIDCMHLAPNLFRTLFKQEDLLDLSVNIKGLQWKNPIGLAAGLDKNAKAVNALVHMGFAAIEIGTVTHDSQLGNSTPRIFRYTQYSSLRNSMGFPNDGSNEILQRVKRLRIAQSEPFSLGVNLGKNKDVTDEQAILDQMKMAQEFAPYCEYLVINISSPNTSGLRDWQQQQKLDLLLKNLQIQLKKVMSKPLFIKISPDLDESDLEAIVQVAKSNNIDGIIATNTTIIPEMGSGGVSGQLLANKATLIRSRLLNLTRNTDMAVIGVGGISNAEQILAFLTEGGDAVQIYSALIFHGPNLINQIKKDMCRIIQKDQSKTLKEYLSKRRNLKWS